MFILRDSLDQPPPAVSEGPLQRFESGPVVLRPSLNGFDHPWPSL